MFADLKKQLSKYHHDAILIILLGLLISSLWMPYASPTITRVRNTSYDLYQRFFPRIYQTSPVGIIAIDNASLDKIGQFPWSRLKMAELVNKLEALGAKVIAFDMLFSEADRTSPEQLSILFSNYPDLKQPLSKLPDNDALFAKAIEQANVVTSFMLKKSPHHSQLPTVKAGTIIQGSSPFPSLNCVYPETINSLPLFEHAAKGNGSVAYVADEDGIIRSIPLFLCLHDALSPTGYRLAPSLSLEAVRIFKNQKNYQIYTNSSQQIQHVKLGKNFKIFPTTTAQMWLHYRKSMDTDLIPAWKVFEGKVDKTAIEGKIIFIGVTASNLLDLRFNPFGEIVAGIKIHAQAAEQLLQGNYLQEITFETLWDSLFLIFIAWFFYRQLQKRNGMTSFLILVSIIILLIIIGVIAFLYGGVFFDPLVPILGCLILFSAIFIQKQLKTEAEKRWLREAFGRYISPNRVKHLIEHPDSLTLGGEYRECSFVMTDLAGFTTLMENHPPHHCVTLLNDYLDGMIQIAFKYNGTLDRIVGDAVAVIFSAPIIQPEHQQQALACALEMDTYAMKFSQNQSAEGVKFGITRIGVCSGKVLIGNFGGKTMFDYRALGDPINTASRLEGANKYFGTRICASESTLKACPNFKTRPIGELILKGKAESIHVSELLSVADYESELIQDYLVAYQKLKQQNFDAEEYFKKLVENYPDDALSRYHYQRLENEEIGTLIKLKDK